MHLREENRVNGTYKKPNVFLSVFLCSAAVISMCAFIVLLALRAVNILPGIIQHTDFLGMLEQSEEGEHAYYITDQINGLPFSNTEVTLEDLDALIKSDAVSEEISVIADGYVRAFGRGDLDHHVTADDIAAAARNIKPELNDFFDHQMTESDIKQMAHTLDDIIDFKSMTLGGLMEDFDIEPEEIQLPFFVTSSIPLWIAGLISAIILFLIFLIRSGNVAGASLAVGIPVALAGLFMFAGSLYFSAYPEVFGETVYHYFEQYSAYIDGPVNKTTQYGFAFSAAGVLIIVISFMIRRFLQINKASQMTREA